MKTCPLRPTRMNRKRMKKRTNLMRMMMRKMTRRKIAESEKGKEDLGRRQSSLRGKLGRRVRRAPRVMIPGNDEVDRRR